MGLTIVRMTGIGGVTTIEIGMVAFIVDGIMMAAVVGIAANSKAVRFRQSQRIGRLVSEAPEVGRRCIEAQSRNPQNGGFLCNSALPTRFKSAIDGL
jgi:hypothetical protein